MEATGSCARKRPLGSSYALGRQLHLLKDQFAEKQFARNLIYKVLRKLKKFDFQACPVRCLAPVCKAYSGYFVTKAKSSSEAGTRIDRSKGRN